jgi:uncharacterized membrane protein
MTTRDALVFAAVTSLAMGVAACGGDRSGAIADGESPPPIDVPSSTPPPTAGPDAPAPDGNPVSGGVPSGGGPGPSAPADRDGDGIPDAEDGYPDDATRFASYEAVQLARLRGGSFGAAVGINDSSAVVGLSDDGAGTVKAVKWDARAPSDAVELRPLEANGYAAAYAIDTDGTAAGEAEKGGAFVPAIWPAGTLDASELSLDGFGPPGSAYATCAGAFVGEATRDGEQVAVLWPSASAVPVALGTLGGPTGSALHLSTSGWIVGTSTTPDGASLGALWILDGAGAAGAAVPLHPLPGHVTSAALWVNARGDVVGESESAGGAVHAVLWPLTGVGLPGPAIDLGEGSAVAIDDRTHVLGHRATAGPVLWDLRNTGIAGAIFAAALPGRAYGMNASGSVVGSAGGQAFVAVPAMASAFAP